MSQSKVPSGGGGSTTVQESAATSVSDHHANAVSTDGNSQESDRYARGPPLPDNVKPAPPRPEGKAPPPASSLPPEPELGERPTNEDRAKHQAWLETVKDLEKQRENWNDRDDVKAWQAFYADQETVRAWSRSGPNAGRGAGDEDVKNLLQESRKNSHEILEDAFEDLKIIVAADVDRQVRQTAYESELSLQ